MVFVAIGFIAVAALFGGSLFAVLRECCRFAIARLMRERIYNPGENAPERATQLAARVFKDYPPILYVSSFAATSLLLIALFSSIVPVGGALIALIIIIVVAVYAAILYRREHSHAANFHPVGLYIYTLERLPGLPQHLKAGYLTRVFSTMRTRHAGLFPRWLSLAGQTFSPGELAALLSAAAGSDLNEWKRQQAFNELLNRDPPRRATNHRFTVCGALRIFKALSQAVRRLPARGAVEVHQKVHGKLARRAKKIAFAAGIARFAARGGSAPACRYEFACGNDADGARAVPARAGSYTQSGGTARCAKARRQAVSARKIRFPQPGVSAARSENA